MTEPRIAIRTHSSWYQ